MKLASRLLLVLSIGFLAGCSTPPLEDHGQTRFEQQQAGVKDSSDRERADQDKRNPYANPYQN